MATGPARASQFDLVADPSQIDDTDLFVVLRRENTTGTAGAATGTLQTVERRDMPVAIDSHGYPPVRMSQMFPSILDTAHAFNTMAFSYNSTARHVESTNVERLYAVYVDSARGIRIARRDMSLPGTANNGSAWNEVDLSAKFTAGAVGHDEHHVCAMFIDADGYKHIFGNMHADPLAGRYVVCRVVNSMTAADFVAADFESGATSVTQMTYPAFIKCSNGTHLMLYRDGVPGNGDLMIKRYTPDGTAPPASGNNPRWGAVTKLVDGKSESRYSYFWNPATDPNNTAKHWLFMCWRDNAQNNEKMALIYTPDNGATWKKPDGTALTLPITKATAYSGSMVVDDIALENVSTFIQQGGACVDLQGRPWACYSKGFFGVRIWYVTFWDGSSYQTRQVGTSSNSAARMDVFCSPQGRVYVIYTNRVQGKNHSIRIQDVTPDPVGAMMPDACLADLSVGIGTMEVAHNHSDVWRTGCIDFIYAPCGNLADDDITTPDDEWFVRGNVITVDISRAHEIVAGRVQVPYERIVASVPLLPAGVTRQVVQSAVGDVGLGALQIPGELAGRSDFCVVRIFATVWCDASTTMTVKLAERTAAQQVAGTGETLTGNRAIAQTTAGQIRIMDLPLTAISNSGEVTMYAGITAGTGLGYIRGGVIQLVEKVGAEWV